MVAVPHGPARGGRDVLPGDAGLDSLRVACGALDDGGVHGNEPSVAFLLALAAAFADRDDDLMGRSSGVAGAAQRQARHHGERLLVVERAAVGLSQGAHRLAEEREHVGRDVEAEHVPSRLGAGRIGRPVARDAPADELFDLADGASIGGSEPFGIGVDNGDTRQFANGGVTESA
jgi:hypothetical protein